MTCIGRQNSTLPSCKAAGKPAEKSEGRGQPKPQQGEPSSQPPQTGKVAILEPGAGNPKGTHWKNVAEVLKQSGIEPENIVPVNAGEIYRIGNNRDQEAPPNPNLPLNKRIELEIVNAYDSVSKDLENILAKPDGIRSVNMSMAISPATMASWVAQESYSNPKTLKELQAVGSTSDFQELNLMRKKDGMPPEPMAKEDEWTKNHTMLAAKYIKTKVDSNSKPIQEARKRWQETTKKAAEQGVHVFVGVGNGNTFLEQFKQNGVSSGDDSGYNEFAKSDYVSGIGGMDDKNTSHPGDDVIWASSDVGSRRYYPTVVADSVDAMGKDDVTGTSYATPAGVALDEKLRRENPNLTQAQIKSILSSTARKLPDAPVTQQGAGAINPEAALAEAKRLRQATE